MKNNLANQIIITKQITKRKKFLNDIRINYFTNHIRSEEEINSSQMKFLENANKPHINDYTRGSNYWKVITKNDELEYVYKEEEFVKDDNDDDLTIFCLRI